MWQGGCRGGLRNPPCRLQGGVATQLAEGKFRCRRIHVLLVPCNTSSQPQFVCARYLQRDFLGVATPKSPCKGVWHSENHPARGCGNASWRGCNTSLGGWHSKLGGLAQHVRGCGTASWGAWQRKFRGEARRARGCGQAMKIPFEFAVRQSRKSPAKIKL